MGRYDDHVVTDAGDYFAKWGPKGFTYSSDKVVPFWDLATSYALKQGNNIDTSGTEPTNTTGREVQVITFRTKYAAYLGTDPKAQMHEWYDLMEDVWPFYVGGEQFGPPLLQLQSVDWSNYEIAGDGTMLSVEAAVTLREWWEGIEEDEGWLTPPEPEVEDGIIFTGDIFNSGLSNVQIIWLFLRQHGFSEAAAAGVIGNMAQESGFEPNINEYSGGGGYGLAQWTGTRRNDLINWCNSNGYDYRTLEGQLNFLIYEFEQPYYQTYLSNYKNITDVWTATDQWLTYFEGCTVRTPVVNWPNRLENANKYYNQLQGYTGPVVNTATGVSGGGSGVIETQLQSQIVYSAETTSPSGPNWCADWVCDAFDNAGLGFTASRFASAKDYAQFCFTTDLSQLKPGMIVVATSSNTGSAGRIHGHIGIYIGNGLIKGNEGWDTPERTIASFQNVYGTLVPLQIGWMNNVPLA